MENWPAKVLSLGLAIILFVFHRVTNLEERFFSVPLNIERKGSLIPSSSYPRMIRLKLRGESTSIFSITDDEIEVYVNLEKFDVPGTYTVPVQWRKKGAALETEPLQINVDPMEITLSLDHMISKFVPLTVTLQGQVEPGYAMVSYSLNPTQVIIDGPAELMGSISELYTEVIDLEGRNSNFSETVNVLNRNPLILIRGNGTSQFHGIISQIIPVRNITNVPITITGLMKGLAGELEIKSGSIRLEGENHEAVDKFEAPPDFHTVDCSGINKPGIYTLRVQTMDAGNVNLKVDPAEVRIRISLAAGDEKS